MQGLWTITAKKKINIDAKAVTGEDDIKYDSTIIKVIIIIIIIIIIINNNNNNKQLYSQFKKITYLHNMLGIKDLYRL